MKPKVAILVADMRYAGGTQRVAHRLASLLGDEFESVVLTCETLPSAPVFYDSSVRYQSLNTSRAHRGRLSLAMSLLRIGRALRKYVKTHQIDVVLSLWSDLNVINAIAGLGTGTRTIGCEHIQFGEASRPWMILRKFAYRYLSAVVCLTDAELPLYKRINKHSLVISNFAEDLGVSPFSERQRSLLTIGHFIPRKGVDRLLWELADPLLRAANWKLVIVGGGELGNVDWGYSQYVSSLVNLLRLGDKVEFHPATGDIQRYYESASAFVMGSRSEGLPMVLIEAKMAGLPVIAFDCPTGPKEIIRHGVDGFLVAEHSGDFPKFAETVMSDDETRRKMGVAAREDALARFSAAAARERWRSLISGLLGTSR